MDSYSSVRQYRCVLGSCFERCQRRLTRPGTQEVVIWSEHVLQIREGVTAARAVYSHRAKIRRKSFFGLCGIGHVVGAEIGRHIVLAIGPRYDGCASKEGALSPSVSGCRVLRSNHIPRNGRPCPQPFGRFLNLALVPVRRQA